MNRREDPYSQGMMIVGIIAAWVLIITVFTQLDKPVLPKLWESITSIF